MQCYCGFTCGTEQAFRKHLDRFTGTPSAQDHQLVRYPAPQPGNPNPGMRQTAPPSSAAPRFGPAAGMTGQMPPPQPRFPGYQDPYAEQAPHAGMPRAEMPYTGPLSGGRDPPYSAGMPGGEVPYMGASSGDRGMSRGEMPRMGAPSGERGASGAAAPSDTSAPARPPKLNRSHRAMSYISQEALDGLSKTSAELDELEARVDEISEQVKRGELTAGQGTTQLAQIESAANKVECDKVDAIYTSELKSGKEEAKQEKKEQIRRLEKLFDKLEQRFKWLKTLPQ